MITNCKELYLKVHLEHSETIKQAIYNYRDSMVDKVETHKVTCSYKNV